MGLLLLLPFSPFALFFLSFAHSFRQRHHPSLPSPNTPPYIRHPTLLNIAIFVHQNPPPGISNPLKQSNKVIPAFTRYLPDSVFSEYIGHPNQSSAANQLTPPNPASARTKRKKE
ncbi:hypothetical protein K457DRAFT_232665 [Linnemannia elongata AG-77]|uniref:Uncharacterized protein n=1 Tax=Linnemannia elongata AG-77 TaxID=1314771 RepID=A0A197JG17_9FUNG|nr:hypothetical protein K457DRAFT_232665 [Linnemannia elongata AG-77]